MRDAEEFSLGIRMGEFKGLEFTASDFTAAPTSNAAAMAGWANKKLLRKLEKATVVYCAKGYGHYDGWTENNLDLDGSATHKARLICIEEIK